MKTFHVFKWSTLAALLLLSFSALAQNPLDGYIQQALQANIALQQKAITLQQAENGLKQARNYFLPSIQLLGDYTSGDGGRSIAIPVGDLLNPVYQSLNQLTQTDGFPQIENVNENFFPKNFYDARVRTSLPLINSDLVINRSIKSKQLLLADLEVKSYKRQLIFEVTEAYFKHLAAAEAVKIYKGALTIVEKNVQIAESLKKNGKGLPAQVLRSQSEAEKVKAELNSAINTFSNSRKYFNFLLNRDLDAEIDLAYNVGVNLTDDYEGQVGGREEIAMTKLAEEIAISGVKLNQFRRLPKVNAFLDLGSQATDWQFNDQSQYYLAGVQLSLPLFQGFNNQLNINQARLDQRKARLNIENTALQLKLAADVAAADLRNAQSNHRASQQQLKAAESYFNLIEIGYREGLNSLIEFLDARNQLTTSAILHNVRTFELLISKSKLERENASLTINN